MQMPNAQGLAGLMSQGRAPQMAQQPMPSPMKASPMAGLGSVEDRVAAYRGNPAPLQQRYQMSQDLLDLLALQKIKSEKDAAARQMQLAMGQQQAAQGMEPQTIAQQREKEVHDLTKAELAQQRGETAQRQAEQQQENMQRALSGGIARAPGAQAAAQPTAMATGGIVAFAGEEGSLVGEEDPEFDAEGNPRSRSERERIMAKNERMRALKSNAQGLGALRGQRMAGFQAAESGMPERMAEFYKPRRPDVTNAAQAVQRPGATPEKIVTDATAATPPAAPGAPRVPPAAEPALSGIPGATPRAAPAAPATPAAAPGAPAGGLTSLVDKTAEGLMTQDPAAVDRAKQEEIRKLYQLTPEQRAIYDQGIAQRQKMFDEAYDPERQRREGLKQYLIGAGGRRYGEFAGGAGAAMGYDETQRQAKLKDFEAVQKAREGLVGLEREGIKPSIEGGLTALKEASTGQRSGLEAGTRRVEGALDRDSRERISREGNRIQAMIAQATRDQTLETRRQGFLGDINKTETRALSDLQKGPIGKAIAGLEQMKAMNPKGFAKEQQQQLDDLNRQMQDAEQVIRAQMDVYREQLGGFGGKGSAKSGSSMSPEDRALVEKYSKGK